MLSAVCGRERLNFALMLLFQPLGSCHINALIKKTRAFEIISARRVTRFLERFQ